MLGLNVGITSVTDIWPVSKNRVRMSLALEATINLSICNPMRRAAYPAKTLPKLPVGTENITLRYGAPKAKALQK